MGRKKLKRASPVDFLEVLQGISDARAGKGSQALEFIIRINTEGDISLQHFAFEEDRKHVKWLIQLLRVFLGETELVHQGGEFSLIRLI